MSLVGIMSLLLVASLGFVWYVERKRARRTAQVRAFLETFRALNGREATIRDVMEFFGMSLKCAFWHMTRIVSRGVA